jgi:hypothetical protein
MNLLRSLLVFPGACFAAFQFFNPVDTASVPKLLSQTGLYSDIAGKVPDTALKYFDINAPLWSDGAAKQRWIILPPGKRVTYVDTTDVFDYPDSVVFVKNFLLDQVEGDSNTRRYWETRLLVHRKDAQGVGIWYGFSYKWNGDATDAHLVSLETGFDTAFQWYPRGLSGPQSYKKWHYPTRNQCNRCHLQNQFGTEIVPRTILGFFPAQLKRAAPLQPSTSQIAWLFSQGTFTGTLPTPQQLARRWKNIHDPIPGSLSPEERFRVIDTMARSYIAGNCSGCHSLRGMPGSGAPGHVDYDYYDVKPRIEMGLLNVIQSMDLNIEDTSSGELKGRLYYLDAVRRAGLNTSVGAVWDMARPASGFPTLVQPGYPSYSTLLFRQWVRQTPSRDSADTRRQLASSDPNGWASWIFSQPWGTPAWFNLLGQHSVHPNNVLNHGTISEINGSMPPVPVSFLPDAEAMKILGEWVKNYRTLYVVDSTRIVTGVRPAHSNVAGGMPVLRGGIIYMPVGSEQWIERPELLNAAGRRYPLMSVGKGRYALPAGLPAGIYYLRAGKRALRIPILN